MSGWGDLEPQRAINMEESAREFGVTEDGSSGPMGGDTPTQIAWRDPGPQWSIASKWIKLTREDERSVTIRISSINAVTESGPDASIVHAGGSTFYVTESRDAIMERITVNP